MSANNLITSTTCAQSIDFGMPAIVMMEGSEGRLVTWTSITDVQEKRLLYEFGRFKFFTLRCDVINTLFLGFGLNSLEEKGGMMSQENYTE